MGIIERIEQLEVARQNEIDEQQQLVVKQTLENALKVQEELARKRILFKEKADLLRDSGVLKIFEQLRDYLETHKLPVIASNVPNEIVDADYYQDIVNAQYVCALLSWDRKETYNSGYPAMGSGDGHDLGDAIGPSTVASWREIRLAIPLNGKVFYISADKPIHRLTPKEYSDPDKRHPRFDFDEGLPTKYGERIDERSYTKRPIHLHYKSYNQQYLSDKNFVEEKIAEAYQSLLK